MGIEQLKNQLAEHAKDIKLNLSSILTPEGAPDLSQKQILSIALASAYASRSPQLVAAMLDEVKDKLQENEIAAAKSAAAIMAMNNVYYRFVHLVSDKSYASIPAKLRMNAIANPGVDKLDYELSCMAVSAINGCGMCMDAHANTLEKAGASKIGVQSAVRIGAVMNAVAMALETS